MPSAEHEAEAHPREERLELFCQAVRFRGERPAGQVYSQVQETIFRNDCDLSAYRFQLNKAWHVAVLGNPPSECLEKQIDGILSIGSPAHLQPDILLILKELRKKAIQQGSWVERHYRPGHRL